MPLRIVAAAADMDSTLLSKVELGQRLPTEKQIPALAAYFSVPLEDMEAKRIEEKFWIEHGTNPAAIKAAGLIGRASQAPSTTGDVPLAGTAESETATESHSKKQPGDQNGS